MNVDRISITMDPELGAAVREAAERAGVSLSAWVAGAAAERLRHQRLGEAIHGWEAESGALSDDELAEAAARLGLEAARR
jgi:hypothetical protein